MFPLLQHFPDLIAALAEAEQDHRKAADSLKRLRELVEPFIVSDDPRDKNNLYRSR